MDISSRQFSSSCLAATAIYHLIDRCRESLLLITGKLSSDCGHYQMKKYQQLYYCTGLQYADINICVDWMLPFVQVLLKHGISPIKHLSNVLQSEAHNIQTHDLSLGMLVSKF